MGALVALSTVGKAVGPLWRTFQDNNMRLFATLYMLPLYMLPLYMYILAVYRLVGVHTDHVQPGCCTSWPCTAWLLYILAVYSLVVVHTDRVQPGCCTY